MAERGLALARSGRSSVTPGPPLEQAAERERRRLAGTELCDEARAGRVLGSMIRKHVGPASFAECAHTSTTTGRIIGRRPVLS